MKNINLRTLLIGLLSTATIANADFRWGATTAILGPDDPTNAAETSFNTALNPGAAFTSSGGFFVQLIRVNGAKDDAVANGTTGVTDDTVVSETWIGSLLFTPPTDGQFDRITYNPDNDGDYYVRAWAGASASADGLYGTGTATIPSLYAGTDHIFYGDSAVFSNGGDSGVNFPPLTNFGSTPDAGAAANNPIVVNQLLQLVPEPGTLGLFGLGAMMLFHLQRRKKRNEIS